MIIDENIGFVYGITLHYHDVGIAMLFFFVGCGITMVIHALKD